MGLTVVAAGLACGIAWLQWPRPPELDGERWFKVLLVTLLRGRIEAGGGDVDAFEDAVIRFVPYHPAGRLPERKVGNPVAATLPGARLPGEQALLEALRGIEGAEARWARMYDTDERALDARLEDPVHLGEAYDPARAGTSWDAVAAWGAGDDAGARALHGRLDATWVLVRGRDERRAVPMIEALADELPGAVEVPWGDGGAEGLLEALRSQLDDVGDRLVLVGEEAGAARILRALAQAAEVRDQVLAVLSVGGVIGGRSDEEGELSETSCQDWLGTWFAQRHLDTDVVRLTPYLALQWLDRRAWPPGAPGLALQHSRFPEPDPEGATAETVEVVDLGPLPVDPELPRDLVARALIAVVALWVGSRR